MWRRRQTTMPAAAQTPKDSGSRPASTAVMRPKRRGLAAAGAAEEGDDRVVHAQGEALGYCVQSLAEYYIVIKI